MFIKNRNVEYNKLFIFVKIINGIYLLLYSVLRNEDAIS